MLTAFTIVIIIYFFLTHMIFFLNEVVSFLKKSKVSWKSLHIHQSTQETLVAHILLSSLLALSCPLVKMFTNNKLSPRMELRTVITMESFFLPLLKSFL